jgi:hypothetical protein
MQTKCVRLEVEPPLMVGTLMKQAVRWNLMPMGAQKVRSATMAQLYLNIADLTQIIMNVVLVIHKEKAVLHLNA